MAKGFQIGHVVSQETRKKIGDALRRSVEFSCDNCGNLSRDKPSSFVRKKRHFCGQECYSIFRRDKLPIEEHARWSGGISSAEAHRRWKKKNPERMSFLKSRRYARERGALGSHTFEQWRTLREI